MTDPTIMPWQLGEPLVVGQTTLTPRHQAPSARWALGDGIIVWRQIDRAMSRTWQALLGQLQQVGVPTWLDEHEELVALRGPALGSPLEGARWRRLDLLEAAQVCDGLVQLIAALHAQGHALGGLRRDELIWDDQRRVLWLAGLPRLQPLKVRDAEQLWAEVQLVGQLLYESYTGQRYPGPKQVVELIRERDAQRQSGLLMPALVQILASCSTPFGDLAYLDIQELARDLRQLIVELEPPMQVRVGARSTQGNNIFRRNNQDSCGHVLFESLVGSQAQQAGFFCVADGIGGQADGERASGLAVRSALEAFSRAWTAYGAEALREQIGELARGIAKVVSQHLVLDGELGAQANRGGTTFTGLALVGDRVGLCHVGDSSAFLVRQGQVVALTRDHTLAQLLTSLGELEPDDLPKSHIARRTISRFLTTNYELELERVDGFSDQCQTALGLSGPEGQAWLTLRRGDVLLVMSDGLSGEVDAQDVASMVSAHSSPQALCDALVELALERAGRDNITVLALSCR